MKPECSLFSSLSKNKRLEEICKRHNVRELFIFGSAIRRDFNSEKSDIDFLVSFKKMTYTEHADSYFGLLKDLEEFFGLSVDLLEPEAVKNPYLKKSIEESRVIVYSSE